MSPTFSRNRHGVLYRYYVSAPLQQGATLKDEDAIGRVPAEAIEELVLERLAMLKVCEPSLAAAGAVLTRVEVHAAGVHLLMPMALFCISHEAPEAGLERVGSRLPRGDQVIIDQALPQFLRVILPVRMKLRGGRVRIMTPDGGAALTRPLENAPLIKALRAAAAQLRQHNAHPALAPSELQGAAAPADSYLRNICKLAFLAPDIQLAILSGRQPPGMELERLVHGEVPLDWAQQRRLWGFSG
jgi:site-specific DNA recombinase